MGNDDQRGTVQRSLGRAIEYLAPLLAPAGLGHALAFEVIKEWGVNGVLYLWGNKPTKLREFTRISPAELERLEAYFEISALPDRAFTITSDLYRGLDVGYLDVVVDWLQFERLVEGIAPVSVPAVVNAGAVASAESPVDESAVSAANDAERTSEKTAPASKSPVSVESLEADLGGRPSADTQPQPSAPTPDVLVPAESEPEVEPGAPPPDAQPDEVPMQATPEPGGSAESPADSPKVNRGGRPTDREMLREEADWRLRHNESRARSTRAFARELHPWLEVHGIHRSKKTNKVMTVDRIEDHVRDIFNAFRNRSKTSLQNR
jgi:hypothetical protein